MGPTWGLSGADRTQVGLMLAPWTLLSGSMLVRAPDVYDCFLMFNKWTTLNADSHMTFNTCIYERVDGWVGGWIKTHTFLILRIHIWLHSRRLNIVALCATESVCSYYIYQESNQYTKNEAFWELWFTSNNIIKLHWWSVALKECLILIFVQTTVDIFSLKPITGFISCKGTQSSM